MKENGIALPPVCKRYDIAAESLSPVDRIVLTSDGTVMRTLEALTGNCVDVKILERTVENDVLSRTIVLRSPDEQLPLAWAESSVTLSNLRSEHARRLRNGTIGIGELVRNNRLETYREINSIEYRVPPEETPEFVETDSRPIMERTYDIHCRNVKVMTITEYFRRDLEQFA